MVRSDKVKIYYLDNIFQGKESDIEFLLDVVFGFLQSGEFLYFDFGYSLADQFSIVDVEVFEDNAHRIWYHPRDKVQARQIEKSFDINCIILKKKNDINSCKYRLKIVESPDSIELMVTEYEKGDFQELLHTNLRPFLEQGVKVLLE